GHAHITKSPPFYEAALILRSHAQFTRLRPFYQMKEILQSITKFTGADTDDFQLWQQKVIMYLSTKDLEVYIDQDPALPATTEELRNDKKAKSIICCCLHDLFVSSIMKEPTAHKA
ncbi:hypothetical protein, partial [Bacillus sp. SRB_331]|uniref:hypothetical protein n=1 Tax=Bacillus sp. SRB_331 TaxID=1969379 RepID=UPI000DC2B9CE